MAIPQITNNRTRLFFDRDGLALQRLVGAAIPAVWLRGQGRLPALSEAKLLSDVTGSGPNLLLWAVSKASDHPARSFRYFPDLAAMRIAGADLMAITGLGSLNRPSHIDIADGTNCDPQAFERFVADSTFGRLSGVIFGPPVRAQTCIPILAQSVEKWGVNTGTAGEGEFLETIDALRAQGCAPVVCIADSDTRNYWAIVVDKGTTLPPNDREASLATAEEFAAWERIGWDVRSLNRSLP